MKLIFVKGSLHARHWVKCFICMTSRKTHNTSMTQVLISSSQRRKLRLREGKELASGHRPQVAGPGGEFKQGTHQIWLLNQSTMPCLEQLMHELEDHNSTPNKTNARKGRGRPWAHPRDQDCTSTLPLGSPCHSSE